MITKIRRAGGTSTSLATTIPKTVVRLFDLKDGEEIIWTPVKDGVHVSKFRK